MPTLLAPQQQATMQLHRRLHAAPAAARVPNAAAAGRRSAPLLLLLRNRQQLARASTMETMSIDEFGQLQWDGVEMGGSWPTERVLEGYELRRGQTPASAPTSTLPTMPSSLTGSKKPVVLVRDTNAWCPFCERVWLALEEKAIPYDCVLIELYNKPSWYKDIVPTSLVPAVAFSEDGAVVWESKDILLELERRFPHAEPLLPADDEEQQQALDFIAELEDAGVDKAGYAFMTGGRMLGRGSSADADSPPPDLASLEAAFLKALDWFESALKRHDDGPYLLGSSFSLVDIMAISSMERLAAGLPKFRRFNLRSNPAYPATAAWFAAISARPAYQRPLAPLALLRCPSDALIKQVCSDDQTLQLLFGRMVGAGSSSSASAAGSSAASAAAAASAAFAATPKGPPSAEEKAAEAARKEAADTLQACLGDVVRDILAKAGVTRYQSSPYGSTTRSFNGHKPRVALAVQDAVELQVIRVLKALLLGAPGAKPATSVAAAFGAVAATFLRSRYAECGTLSSLSPAAVQQLQAACTAAITQSYADGVEALPFAPPADEAAANAAHEAAAKVQKNKAAIVEDILRKSGLARPGTSVYGSTYMSVNGNRPVVAGAVRAAVERHLDRLCGLLLSGSAGPKAEDVEAAAVGAAALAFFRNRASAPRDMSAAATVVFRAACDEVLKQVY